MDKLFGWALTGLLFLNGWCLWSFGFELFDRKQYLGLKEPRVFGGILIVLSGVVIYYAWEVLRLTI